MSRLLHVQVSLLLLLCLLLLLLLLRQLLQRRLPRGLFLRGSPICLRPLRGRCGARVEIRVGVGTTTFLTSPGRALGGSGRRVAVDRAGRIVARHGARGFCRCRVGEEGGVGYLEGRRENVFEATRAATAKAYGVSATRVEVSERPPLALIARLTDCG